MFLEDLEPRRGIFSQPENIRWYIGVLLGSLGWCGRNCITERRRRWKTQRKCRAGGGIIYYDKEVVRGVAMSDDVAWLY